MELDIIKSQTTWNDASQSINLNFAKIRQALASIGSGGGTVDAIISTVYDISKFGSISTNDNSATFNAFAIDSLYKRIKILEDEEVDFTGYATEQWVLNKSYITAAALSPYLKTSDANSTFATLVAFNALSNKTSALEGGLETLQGNHLDLSNEVDSLDDNLGTLSSNFNALKGRFDALDGALNDDVSGKINTWNEIVDFLDEYNGSKDLATILSGMNADIALRLKTADFDAWKTDVYSPLASRVSTAESNISTHTTQISGLTTRMGNAETNISTNAKGIAENKTAIATNKNNISANTTAITNLGKRVTANEGNIAKILKWFAVDADGNLYTTYNLYSTKEISANGLSIGSGSSGGGLISQVYGTTAFGTIAAESNSATFNAYAIDSLYKRIVSLEGKATAVSFVPALTSGKQIGTLSIDGVSTVLYGVDAYSKADADGTFLKLWGGTISVSGYYGLRLKSTGQDAAALAFENKDSVSGYLMYAGGSDWKVTAANWGATYNLLHSNNYSQYALPLTGGTIKNGDNGTPLVIDTTHTEIGVPFRINNINKGWVGHTASIGTYLYDYTSKKFIGVKTDGTPVYYDGSHRTLIHSGNYSQYALPLTGGSIVSSTTGCPLYLANTKETWNTIGFKGNSHSDYAYFGLRGDGSFFVTGIGWNGTYNLIHSGNVGEYALPLSGGTISGNTYIPLKVVGTSVRTSIGFSKDASAFAYLTYNGGSSWAVTNEYYNNEYTLIHSGNYNSYAPKLDGTGASGTWGIDISGKARGLVTSVFATINANEITYTDCIMRYLCAISDTSTNLPVFSSYQNSLLVLPLHDNGATAQMYFTRNDEHIYYRSHHTAAWKTVAFTDSNVASADVIATTYANQSIDIGAESRVRLVSLTASNSVDLGAPKRYVSGLSVMSNYVGWQLVCGASEWDNTDFYIRKLTDIGKYLAWRQIAFTDSNVASATKLATARTIWGQSFDGSGNVSGNITLGAASIRGYDKRNILESTANDLMIGYGYTTSSLKTTIFGNTIKLNDAVLINSSGNVTIGSSDLAGTSAKLYINGSTKIAGNIYDGGSYQMFSRGISGDIHWQAFGSSSSANVTVLEGGNWVSLKSGGSDRLTVKSNGNVLIGTTTDTSGNKLQVNGTILSTPARESAYSSVLRGYQSGIVAGDMLSVVIGKEATTKNAAYFGFTYDGSGSSKNFASIGFHSVDNILCVAATSYVGIGTTAPQYKLDVNGTLRATGAVTMSSTLSVTEKVTAKYLSVSYDGLRFSDNANYALFMDSSNKVNLSGYYGINLNGAVGVTGLLSANSGVKVASGQALTFLDARGKEHKLTYDSTAGAFKFDGNILVLGDGQFNAIN